jgi:hypothetical protein
MFAGSPSLEIVELPVMEAGRPARLEGETPVLHCPHSIAAHARLRRKSDPGVFFFFTGSFCCNNFLQVILP